MLSIESCANITLKWGKTKMEKVKRINRKLALAIAAILLLSSSLVLLNSVNTVSAQYPADLTADDIYGWPVGPGYDSGNTFFNPGPGPNRPDILWQARRPDTGGALSGAPPIAMEGKIFAWGGNRLWAFDALTGKHVANASMRGTPRGFGTATLFKIADGYLAYEASNFIAVHRTDTCEEVGYVAVDTTIMGSHGGGSVMYWGGFYSSYDKLKLTTALSVPPYHGIDTPVHLAVAYDLSDPENPKLAWTWPAPTGIEALGAAPGLAIFGGYGEGEIYALNATTGELVWSAWKNGNAGYISNYWDGKIYHSASSISLTCWNATNGELIFNRQEGPREYFVFGDAIAYGKYLGKNIALPSGYVGAWDAFTGEPLWKTRALYTIAYLVPVVADGKFYCQRYSGAAGGVEAQPATFACWDVNTGELLWELVGFSCATPIIAYGNLYMISDGTLYCVGDSTDPFAMFHGHESVDTPGIRTESGPACLTLAWTYDSGSSISGSAVAGNGKVYFGTLGAEVHCVNAYTGEMEWTFPLEYRMASTPALVGDRLYTGADDGNVYCINAETGEQIWKRPVGGKTQGFWVPAWQARSSPIVVNDRLYVGSLDGNLYCLNANTGTVVWSSPAGSAARPPAGTPLVVESLNTVYISSTDSFLYAFNTANGEQRWRTQLQPTTGFDDRAMISTPVFDRGTLWIGCDTFVLARLNATTGAWMNAITLPYSGRTSTMTPAVTTPSIQTVGTAKYLTIGDGFQLVSFVITDIQYDSNIRVDHTTRTAPFFFGTSYTYGIYIPTGAQVDATTSNTVNLNVSLPNPRGNETHLPIRWERWLGHQVYSSPVISDRLGTLSDFIYFGDDVNSISIINATDGWPVAVYTTAGPVFSSACLYEGYLFMGSQDGVLYAFKDQPVAEFSISAAANKVGEMWNNETLTIRGRLLPTPGPILPEVDEEFGFQRYDTNGYANGTVKLSVTKPDGTDVAMDTTTDNDGWFEFSYNPTDVGEYGWVVYYDGEVKDWITYLPAYSEWTTVTVTSPPTGETTPPEPEGIPIEYVYVAVAVIVIVLVAVGAYIFLRRRK